MSSMDPQDRRLLTRLGDVAAAVDPPPPMMYELGRAAFEMHQLDAELVQLVDDDANALVGVRASGAGAEMLSFEGREVSLDVQVTVTAGRVGLVGQAFPEGSGTVKAQTAEGDVAVAQLDATGCFTLAGLPQTLLRLRIEVPGRAPFVTIWFSP